MSLYEIKAYMRSVTIDKCWLKVEANSEKEALAFAKEHPEDCKYMDGKTVDVVNNEFIDEDSWQVIHIKN